MRKTWNIVWRTLFVLLGLGSLFLAGLAMWDAVRSRHVPPRTISMVVMDAGRKYCGDVAGVQVPENSGIEGLAAQNLAKRLETSQKFWSLAQKDKMAFLVLDSDNRMSVTSLALPSLIFASWECRPVVSKDGMDINCEARPASIWGGIVIAALLIALGFILLYPGVSGSLF